MRGNRIQRPKIAHRHIPHLHGHVRILELRLSNRLAHHLKSRVEVPPRHAGRWRQLARFGRGVRAIQRVGHVGRGSLRELLGVGRTWLPLLLLLGVLLLLPLGIETPVAHHGECC